MIIEGIKVKAFDYATGELIGEYSSCCKAERKLFLRKQGAWSYISRGKKDAPQARGVKSRKTGKVYHFERA